MRFCKPPLNPQQQLDRLIDRGLDVRDNGRALRLLEVTGYFRLIPYLRPFQYIAEDGRRFRAGTGLDRIYSLYRFDSQLRQLVTVVLERTEVAVRAAINNHMAPTYGAHWYLDRSCFRDNYKHGELLNKLQTQLEDERRKFSRERHQIENRHGSPERKQRQIDRRKRENYFRFYAETYTDPLLPPAWAMAEELSLGAISHLYSGLARDRDRKQIARCFQLPQPVLGSWLHTLTFVRNICAHHARLWNRELAVPPRWPRVLPMPAGSAGSQPPRRFFTVALILVYLSEQVSPDTGWLDSLVALIEEFPQIPRDPMEFPHEWKANLRSYKHQNSG